MESSPLLSVVLKAPSPFWQEWFLLGATAWGSDRNFFADKVKSCGLFVFLVVDVVYFLGWYELLAML